MRKPEIIEKLHALYHTNPFVRHMGIVIDDVGYGWAKSHMLVRPEFVNMDGLCHGGVICTLIDNLCGVTGRTLGFSVVTQNISATYIGNIALGGVVCAECRVLHPGRHVMAMTTAAYTEERKLLCHGAATMFVAKPDPDFAGVWDEREVAPWTL